jgi:hypothetical protein|tara:strand:+ start:557 stop:856 length:300 start_codon:yes stop_codon:yes gene_type:complete
MSHQAEMTNIFFTKIDQMTDSHIKMTSIAQELSSDIMRTKDIAEKEQISNKKLTEEVSIALEIGHQTLKKILDNREQAKEEFAKAMYIAEQVFEKVRTI